MTCQSVGTNGLQRHAPTPRTMLHGFYNISTEITGETEIFIEYIDCASLANRNSADCDIGKAGRFSATRYPPKGLILAIFRAAMQGPKDSVW